MSPDPRWPKPAIEIAHLFLPPETEPVLVREPWWSTGKALTLEFRPAPRTWIDDDEEENA